MTISEAVYNIESTNVTETYWKGFLPLSYYILCHTYSTSRGLYFYYVAAAVHPFPLEIYEGLAVVPHLLWMIHRKQYL